MIMLVILRHFKASRIVREARLPLSIRIGKDEILKGPTSRGG